MLILKATERNWGLIGPGDYEKKRWKIDENGWYQQTTSFRSGSPDLPEIPEVTTEGQLDAVQFQKLKEYMDSEWSDETTNADDGEAWEFKMYKDGAVVKHRKPGYIYGIAPYQGMADLLTDLEN